MDTIPKPTSWVGGKEGIRMISTDYSVGSLGVISTAPASLPPSAPTTEHSSLVNFAYRLGAVVKNNDPSIVDHNGVRQEAKLLMSLSSSTSNYDDVACDDAVASNNVAKQQQVQQSYPSSGRITPQSVASASSGGSRRETFCFTCPALSLEDKDSECNNTNASNRDYDDREGNDDSNSQEDEFMTNQCPAVMMGRTLKVDDKDAMRLSSDAMARNIMQSFQKAMQWRIHSWVDSLSAVLVKREQELLEYQQQGDNQKVLVDALYYSDEALLVAALRQIESKIQVLETSTEFKVLHKITNPAAMSKKQRLDEDDRSGLEEGEYVYDVVHVLELQCALSISSPAGNVHIDLNVPGTIKGTFLSSEDNYNEDLTDVNIHVNTAMLATMIERSSRIAVRCSAEALLKGECIEWGEKEETVKTEAAPSSTFNIPSTLPSPKTVFVSPRQTTGAITTSPKRKLTEDDIHPVSGLVVITPARDASSPSDFADSDSDGDSKPSKLQIPDNFQRRGKSPGNVLFPQAIRSSGKEDGSGNDLSFASRLPPKNAYKMLSNATTTRGVVTPLKNSPPEFECREKGPTVPLLELASAAALDSPN